MPRLTPFRTLIVPHSEAQLRAKPMRIALMMFGILLLLTGAVWILQGVNILPGSFMTGQMRWAYAGMVAVLMGGGLLWVAQRIGRV